MLWYQTSDFSYDRFQATLVEDVYISPQYYYYYDTGEHISDMVMKLNNSLNGMVKYPFVRYNRLNWGFELQGFKPRHLDTWMFYGSDIIAIIYVGDVIFFGPDQDNIDEVIKKIEDDGIYFNVKWDVYDFLGVEINTDND